MRKSLIALALILFSIPAFAQQRCIERSKAAPFLKSEYNESLVATGDLGNGSIMEVYATPDGRTWTILIIRPDLMACPVSSGTSLQTYSFVGKAA